MGNDSRTITLTLTIEEARQLHALGMDGIAKRTRQDVENKTDLGNAWYIERLDLLGKLQDAIDSEVPA